MGITKNRLTEEKIKELCRNAFPDKEITRIKELTEGLCNVAYDIEFKDGTCSILKVAPASAEGLMTNEVNMMDAEVKAMKILENHSTIVVPKVLLYDDTGRLLNSKYFFMSKMEGQNWITIKYSLSDEINDGIYEEVGNWHRIMSEIKGTHFGMLSDEKQFEDLYSFVEYLIQNVLGDIERRDIVIGVTKEEILEQLKQDRAYFEEVTQPSFVHWDMWDGNIFVKDNHVCGVIDWERAMWGEAYLDDRFRYHSRNAAFLRGYGKEEFAVAEKVRMRWYDIFLYLTMMAEVTYRQYEDDSQYRWVKPLFDEVWAKRNGW